MAWAIGSGNEGCRLAAVEYLDDLKLSVDKIYGVEAWVKLIRECER